MALTRPKYSQIYDTDWKQSAEVATTGSDVGNLTVGNSQPSSLDGVSLQTGYRILVKDQTNGWDNGLYIVANVGTGSNGWWKRTLDANQNGFVTAGLTVTVVLGSVNGGREFRLTTPDPITLGVTSLTFINPYSAAQAGGANTQVQFNDASIINGSGAFTFNKYTNAVSMTGNVTAGNLIVTSAGQFSGIYNENTTTSGVFVGNAGSGTPSPRVGFFNGNSTQNWQIDNYFGTFRWYTPGVTRMSIDSTGNLSVYGSILPSANITYDLGSPTARFRTGYFSSNTIDLGGSQISVSSSGFNFVVGGSTTTLASNGSITSNTFTAPQVTFSSTTNSTPYQLGSGAIYVAGGMSIAKDIWVSGNIYAGNLISTVANILTSQDSLIYLQNPTVYPYNYSIGFYGHFVGGPANVYAHTAFVRNYTDNAWYLISNIAEPSVLGNINVTDSNRIFDAINTGNSTVNGFLNVTGNVIASAFIGNGAQLTGLPAGYSNVQVATYFASGTAAGYINTSSNVSAAIANFGSIGTVGAITSTGYINTTANISTAQLNAGQINTTGNVLSTGAVHNALTVNGAVSINSGNTVATGLDIYTVSSATLGQLSLHATTGQNQRQSKIRFYGTFQNSADAGERYVASLRSGFDPTQTNWGSEFLSIYVNNAVNDAASDANQLEIARFTNYNGVVMQGNILPTVSNVYTLGNTTARWNKVWGVSVNAQYADLAEIYTSDSKYPPGTVVIFGGDSEVTISTSGHDPRIAGVVSTNPAYLMNGSATGIPVALTGRVPCQVLGPVAKGDRLVASDIPGVAQVLDIIHYQPGCIIGKALEPIENAEISTIEVVVGRL